jgi:hypothetical protein
LSIGRLWLRSRLLVGVAIGAMLTAGLTGLLRD